MDSISILHHHSMFVLSAATERDSTSRIVSLAAHLTSCSPMFLQDGKDQLQMLLSKSCIFWMAGII